MKEHKEINFEHSKLGLIGIDVKLFRFLTILKDNDIHTYGDSCEGGHIYKQKQENSFCTYRLLKDGSYEGSAFIQLMTKEDLVKATILLQQFYPDVNYVMENNNYELFSNIHRWMYANWFLRHTDKERYQKYIELNKNTNFSEDDTNFYQKLYENVDKILYTNERPYILNWFWD